MSDKHPITVTALPLGEIGDGSVEIKYYPDPPHNRSNYEIEFDFGDDNPQRVYLGDREHVEQVIDALEHILILTDD